MEERENKAVLLHRLQVCDFILVELTEYLDTHPEDAEALKCFEKHRNMREETAKRYTQCYGPITSTDVTGTDRWSWVDDPWPWELPEERRS